MIEPDLLQRIAQILKQEIGPAVDAEYPRTQAFMAAVVLEKLGRQLALTEEHRRAASSDLTALLADLRSLLADGGAPTTMRDAVETLAETRDDAALCRLIDTVYVHRTALGEARFATLLGRIRQALRRSIDRRMAVAG